MSRHTIELETAKHWYERRNPALVRLHDREEERYATAFWTTVMGAGVYAALAFIEPFLIDRLLALSFLFRLGVLPLLALGLLYMISLRRPLLEIHIATGIVVAIAAAMWSYVLINGRAGGPPYYYFAGFLFFCIPNIFMRLKFEAALLSNILIIQVLGLAAWQLPEASSTFLLVTLMMVVTTVSTMLITNWTLERDSYAIYLHKRLSAIDRDELTRRNAELLTLSTTDALTGVGNRRAADMAMQALWSASQNEGRSFALVLLDIDYFKLYNDNYSHVAGDVCLRSVATAASLTAELAGGEVYRFGGEEFLIAAPCADEEDARLMAQSVIDAVRQLRLPHRYRPDGSRCVSVSIGVAWCAATAPGAIADYLQAADVALYRAKATGRNHLQLARPGDTVTSSEPVVFSRFA